MENRERPLRADAERNRRRLLEAATEMFCERGLNVSVAEIAQRAGIGHGTLFRNFPSKEDLIAAIVVERMGEALTRGQALLASLDPGEAMFSFLEDLIGSQRADRALFDAVADIWLANSDIRHAHDELIGVLDSLLVRAQDAGAVRADVGALDILMLVKGACEATRSYQHLDAEIGQRQLDLLRAAVSASGTQQHLRGRSPTLKDLEQAAQAPQASQNPQESQEPHASQAPQEAEQPANA